MASTTVYVRAVPVSMAKLKMLHSRCNSSAGSETGRRTRTEQGRDAEGRLPRNKPGIPYLPEPERCLLLFREPGLCGEHGGGAGRGPGHPGILGYAAPAAGGNAAGGIL